MHMNITRVGQMQGINYPANFKYIEFTTTFKSGCFFIRLFITAWQNIKQCSWNILWWKYNAIFYQFTRIYKSKFHFIISDITLRDTIDTLESLIIKQYLHHRFHARNLRPEMTDRDLNAKSLPHHRDLTEILQHAQAADLTGPPAMLPAVLRKQRPTELHKFGVHCL